ncbi:DNA repair protein complementing XP-A cells like protein [Ditylenchus destructor]|uniref:DNA repair protein complementing XP-A cells like protein n=1 Tax=Ditylenchus destructor TaxID=166010 RepID=A0AAD4RBL4_9BILA|nr:DNA repair protein complementing XP-A cells like protein [Ditylenchus destructor]
MEKKRKSADSRVPIVEKLYRQHQESYSQSGGFDVADDEYAEKREAISDAMQKKRDRQFEHIETPDNCIECGKPLYNAFLWERFNYAVCDLCRDDKGKHKLIARTEAKEKYMLKDCDLDLRKPVLRFISKKNPHNPRYGDMKLYLELQLEERALELHESWEKLEEARELRLQKREIVSERKFERKIKQMRKDMRGDAFKLKINAKHEHDFGEEKDEGNGHYSKTCKTCDHTVNYEKL